MPARKGTEGANTQGAERGLAFSESSENLYDKQNLPRTMSVPDNKQNIMRMQEIKSERLKISKCFSVRVKLAAVLFKI
jgi:hypothetical protein